jgi:hypothetical protein
MKYKYSKYTGVAPLDDLDLDELVSKLSDLLLSSGFDNPWARRTTRGSHAAGAARRDPRGAAQRRRAARRDHRAAARRTRPRGRRGPRAARAADPADHRAMQEGYITPAPDLEAERASGSRAAGGATASAAEHVRFEVTDKAPRLPRLPRAARPARLARQEQLRPPRHARSGDGHRAERRAEAVRVRRHAQPRRQRTILNAVARRRGRGSPRRCRTRASTCTTRT